MPRLTIEVGDFGAIPCGYERYTKAVVVEVGKEGVRFKNGTYLPQGLLLSKAEAERAIRMAIRLGWQGKSL